VALKLAPFRPVTTALSNNFPSRRLGLENSLTDLLFSE
jgi:hypothetical protein